MVSHTLRPLKYKRQHIFPVDACFTSGCDSDGELATAVCIFLMCVAHQPQVTRIHHCFEWLMFVCDRVSLCSPGCSRTDSIDQAELKLRAPPPGCWVKGCVKLNEGLRGQFLLFQRAEFGLFICAD